MTSAQVICYMGYAAYYLAITYLLAYFLRIAISMLNLSNALLPPLNSFHPLSPTSTPFRTSTTTTTSPFPSILTTTSQSNLPHIALSSTSNLATLLKTLSRHLPLYRTKSLESLPGLLLLGAFSTLRFPILLWFAHVAAISLSAHHKSHYTWIAVAADLACVVLMAWGVWQLGRRTRVKVRGVAPKLMVLMVDANGGDVVVG
ncbi:hypothetical protein HK097_008534 [Rhizophlyctis rosea]|uniref:Uncharacterized protein n=1 Tax=Rhizophlyctis rosea TaxID=64517 RepID=A0AAD5SCX9_9FUNG|nr:hypothetical protein HK097_008534 [Rhizophlyctis rosea]